MHDTQSRELLPLGLTIFAISTGLLLLCSGRALNVHMQSCTFQHETGQVYCRTHLQGERALLEAQLSQSQSTAADLQLQVASLEAERKQLEQALQGAHAEIKAPSK